MDALSHTSYIVLALLEMGEPATPYDLKQRAAATIGDFWSVPHTQLYTEPARLAAAGYLSERREETGRRRKLYSRTKRGRDALARWLREPTSESTELRDPGLLQLFFGADPRPLAAVQGEIHRERLRAYEQLRPRLRESGTDGAQLVLESGIAHEREWVRFWERVRAGA